uniref:Uncharacterized protein n=1 Tax=Ditylenchus dipsaci TaxID=166011 RepID=A0A915DMP6_9BILA
MYRRTSGERRESDGRLIHGRPSDSHKNSKRRFDFDIGSYSNSCAHTCFLATTIYLTHLDNDEKLHFARTMLYLKNQLLAFALLFAFVEFLDFLTVHHLFGPWAIIIRDLMYDLTRFLVILCCLWPDSRFTSPPYSSPPTSQWTRTVQN